MKRTSHIHPRSGAEHARAVWPASPAHLLAWAFLALALAGVLALSLTGAPAAFAEDIDTNPSPDEAQQEVERTSKEYEEAKARTEELATQIKENQGTLEELAGQLETQKAKTGSAVRELYKLQCQAVNLVDFILSADSIDDVYRNLDYTNDTARNNVAEFSRLRDLQAQYQSTETELEEEYSQATEAEAAAKEALEQAQKVREEAQARAQALAAAELEGVSPDGVDWSVSKDEFMSTWTARIDAYLAGSPLEGHGKDFAEAAWKYGVDPRWSPAISNTESSKGTYCFLPHNAWGWGQESWDSWEEAIDAHVRGLARGYGYTITVAGAQKYCPPNWEAWYQKTRDQMNSI